MSNRNVAAALLVGAALGRRDGSITHNHTHIEMVDPSIEKGARFLDEVQEKAAARITNAMLVDIPSIDAKLISYDVERLMESDTTEQRIAFKVNGREFDLRVPSDRGEEPAIKALVEQVTMAILKQIPPSTLIRVKF